MLRPMMDRTDNPIEMKVREPDLVMVLLHNHRLTTKETKISRRLLFRFIQTSISKIKSTMELQEAIITKRVWPRKVLKRNHPMLLRPISMRRMLVVILIKIITNHKILKTISQMMKWMKTLEGHKTLEMTHETQWIQVMNQGIRKIQMVKT